MGGSEKRRKPSAGAWAGDRRQKIRRTRHERRAARDRRAEAAQRAEPERRSGSERRRENRRAVTDRRSETGWLSVPLESSPAVNLDPVQELLAVAADARTRAQAPYSGFQVGAALRTPDGRVVAGCNVESATYGLTVCAERVALLKALSDGVTEFTALAVVADTDSPTPPCGSCRQLLWEYCGDIEVLLSNLQGATARYRLAALLPLPFDRTLLE